MTKLESLINGYAAIISPSSPELLRVGAVISSLSRIANFYRVKIKNGQTINTYCNFYFLFLGASGIGKDLGRNVFLDIEAYKEFVELEKKECFECEKKAVEKYKKEYYELYALEEFSVEDSKETKTEKNKAITYARNKVRRIQPIMNESTRPNLEAVGLAITQNNKLGLTITNGEFLMWMKHKKSEAFDMFSFLATGYDNGRVELKGTMANNRGADESVIKDLPLNVVFMSSEALLEDNMINGNLKDFFLTAGARRFVTASEKELDFPLYTQEQVEQEFESKKKETDGIVKEFIGMCEDCQQSGLVLSEEVKKLFEHSKNEMRDYVNQNKSLPEIIKIELLGSSWRALKMSGIIAMLNHLGQNVIYEEDYRESLEWNKKFIRSFRRIVEGNWVEDNEKFMAYIRENPGCKVGDLYKLNIFSKDKIDFKRKYEALLEICREKLNLDGFELIIKTGEDGKSKEHYIKEPEKDLDNIEDFLFQVSISADKAKDFKFHQLTPDKMCKLMENKKGLNYSAGSYAGEHRLQSNWEGGANCLILDIDNEEGELKIEQAKKLFENFTYIIQPTKSHQIDKSDHGVKDRFRIIFPTSDIPKMDTKRFRNIYENFHNVFGITSFGDVKASGDTARFYYPSPHKAQYHVGDHRVNWRIYDYEREVIKPINSQSKDNVFEPLKKYEYLKIGEKEQIHCPYGTHEDKNKSAFVTRKDENAVHCYCSACGITKFSR